MRIISFRKLRTFFETTPDSTTALQEWFHKTKKAKWEKFADVKKSFNSVDSVGNSRFVFNVKGNLYRIVAQIDFVYQTVYIRFVGSHKDYDKLDDIKNI